FFSSRRRHTRSKRDWSSDVCSSDLFFVEGAGRAHPVQWLVRSAVGVDEDRAVRLEHEQALGAGKVSAKPTRVIDRALGNDNPQRVPSLNDRVMSLRRAGFKPRY